MYGSHDMRHIGFRRLTVVIGTPRFWGVTTDRFFSISKQPTAQYFLKEKWTFFNINGACKFIDVDTRQEVVKKNMENKC